MMILTQCDDVAVCHDNDVGVDGDGGIHPCYHGDGA